LTKVLALVETQIVISILNIVDTTKKSTKSKIIKWNFAIVILTTLAILKNFEKTTTSKKLTILKKSIKLKKTRIENI